VRTRAARNRASAESNRVVVRIRPAPETVSGISARVAGQSVTLTWPRQANSGYRVYRAEIAPESAAAASTDASKAVLRMPMVQVAQTEVSVEGPLVLQYLDENVELGHAYLYILRRVARFGTDAVESADSQPVVITVLEPVPPPAPQDVETVVVPATATEPAYISLSWAIRPEAEVAGYAVYRSEQEGVRGARLNQELAGSPTYRDASVAAGRRYFYTVTAMDAAGQESPPSAPAGAQIPQTQP
jgi:fibronectin type 3 domain-containing protein